MKSAHSAYVDLSNWINKIRPDECPNTIAAFQTAIDVDRQSIEDARSAVECPPRASAKERGVTDGGVCVQVLG
jgi:hypothetical protein